MHTKTQLAAAAAILACSVCGPALAQDKPDGQWRGSGGAALSLTSGNTDSRSLLLNADLARVTEADKITLGAAANYARNKTAGVSQTTANRWSLGAGYERGLGPRTFAFGRIGLEADKLIELDQRVALAGGLGYKVIATPETTFNVYGGAGYVTDRYGSAQVIDGKSDTSFSRASLYLAEESAHKLSETTSFKQRLDVYPGVSGDKAVLAKFSAGLAVAMSSTMSLTVGLTDSYNSKPPAGARSNDVGLFTGINVKLGAN